VEWYRPIQAYIPQNAQVIAANGLVYISTAQGLLALSAADGNLIWRFDTELPLGNSPTVEGNTLYVAGLDRKVYALNATQGGAPIWTFSGASAGYVTNPVVADGKVMLGSRDGSFYALNAASGQLVWKYQTGGPINFSAAYKNGVVYFASMDNYAYALHSSDGAQVWKSPQMGGDGFNSYWPVVYTDPTTQQDYVIFVASFGYRDGISPGNDSLDCPTSYCEIYDEFNGNVSGTLAPILSSSPSWALGKPVADFSNLAQYLEANPTPDARYHKPYRRYYYIYQASPGANQTAVEYSTDLDHDGYPEYAPISPFRTNSGNPYPPMVGSDGLLYLGNHYFANVQGLLMGWRMGTPYFALTPIQGAWDEPNAYSAGGNLLYRSICCDRTGDYTSTTGGQHYLWSYDLSDKAPGYDQAWWFSDPDFNSRLAGNFGDINGVYHSHGDQNPLVPYQGHVFSIHSNALISFGTGSARGKLSLIGANAVSRPPDGLSSATLTSRLESEVQKILSAGALRPGYYNAGQFNQAYHELADYFANPGDTLYTLSAAYPYVSAGTQTQLKSYLKTQYSSNFSSKMIANVGWSSGAAREWMPLPPEVSADLVNHPASQGVDSNVWGWDYPQVNFYGMWKYVTLVAPEDAGSAYALAKANLQVPAGGSELYATRPYILNGYIAGYIGFLGMQEAAGKTSSDASLRTQVSNELTRLKQLRAATFTAESPYPSSDQYTKRTLNIARNFMYLTPELGSYLNQAIPATLSATLADYQQDGPEWFVSRYTASIGESSQQNLYDTPAIFQARAYALKQNQTELAKYLDVPAFARGDLFFIQNLVAILQAPQ
jgi:hypothetical protein